MPPPNTSPPTPVGERSERRSRFVVQELGEQRQVFRVRVPGGELAHLPGDRYQRAIRQEQDADARLLRVLGTELERLIESSHLADAFGRVAGVHPAEDELTDGEAVLARRRAGPRGWRFASINPRSVFPPTILSGASRGGVGFRNLAALGERSGIEVELGDATRPHIGTTARSRSRRRTDTGYAPDDEDGRIGRMRAGTAGHFFLFSTRVLFSGLSSSSTCLVSRRVWPSVRRSAGSCRVPSSSCRRSRRRRRGGACAWRWGLACGGVGGAGLSRTSENRNPAGGRTSSPRSGAGL